MKPRHIAFIIDGNGRWAQSRGLPRSAGHKAGYERIPEILETCMALDIQIISVSQMLWTAGSPDVDILVRTGKEKRLSNFMMWQCSNATIHFLDKYWPDINKKDIEQIVKMFHPSGQQAHALNGHWPGSTLSLG